jgi:hypothetical protein
MDAAGDNSSLFVAIENGDVDLAMDILAGLGLSNPFTPRSFKGNEIQRPKPKMIFFKDHHLTSCNY